MALREKTAVGWVIKLNTSGTLWRFSSYNPLLRPLIPAGICLDTFLLAGRNNRTKQPPVCQVYVVKQNAP